MCCSCFSCWSVSQGCEKMEPFFITGNSTTPILCHNLCCYYCCLLVQFYCAYLLLPLRQEHSPISSPSQRFATIALTPDPPTPPTPPHRRGPKTHTQSPMLLGQSHASLRDPKANPRTKPTDLSGKQPKNTSRKASGRSAKKTCSNDTVVSKRRKASADDPTEEISLMPTIYLQSSSLPSLVSTCSVSPSSSPVHDVTHLTNETNEIESESDSYLDNYDDNVSDKHNFVETYSADLSCSPSHSRRPTSPHDKTPLMELSLVADVPAVSNQPTSQPSDSSSPPMLLSTPLPSHPDNPDTAPPTPQPPSLPDLTSSSSTLFAAFSTEHNSIGEDASSFSLWGSSTDTYNFLSLPSSSSFENPDSNTTDQIRNEIDNQTSNGNGMPSLLYPFNRPHHSPKQERCDDVYTETSPDRAEYGSGVPSLASSLCSSYVSSPLSPQEPESPSLSLSNSYEDECLEFVEKELVMVKQHEV